MNINPNINSSYINKPKPVQVVTENIQTETTEAVNKTTIEHQAELESEDSANSFDHAKSFVYGALGMDKPEGAAETTETAYSSGQVLKAIGTVGSIIAIIV